MEVKHHYILQCTLYRIYSLLLQQLSYFASSLNQSTLHLNYNNYLWARSCCCEHVRVNNGRIEQRKEEVSNKNTEQRRKKKS